MKVPFFDTDNENMKENTQKLIDDFAKVEADALAARSKKRASTWSGIISSVAAATSAYTDAKAGLTVPSDQTNALADNANANFSQAADIKQASVSASAVAAQAFNDTYSQMISQLHMNNASFDSDRPLFATDFVELLSDKSRVDLIGTHINDFLDLVPFLKPVVNQYLTAANANSSAPVTLNDIYFKFNALEIDITATEANGTATTKDDLFNYK